jgi:hypothetical protein
MRRPECRLERRGNDLVAYPTGKSSPILRLVPGNVRPATAAMWRCKQDAVRDLTLWGWDVVLSDDEAGSQVGAS